MKQDKTENYAFFDVDGTVTNKNTMLPFLDFCFDNYYKFFKINGRIKKYIYFIKRNKFFKNKTRSFLNFSYYKNFRSMNVEKINYLGEIWFKQQILNKNFLNHKVLQEIMNHQQNGTKVVFVSGAFLPCIRPLAQYLNVDEVICTQPIIKNGHFTGDISYPQTIGQGKVVAIKSQLGDSVDYSKCYAYGDHISDLSMLKLVGHPVVILSDPELSAYAKENNWNIIKN